MRKPSVRKEKSKSKWDNRSNRNAHLLPLMTYPTSSYWEISSQVRPISPRRGIRFPSATKAAIAAPSPGRRALPNSRWVSWMIPLGSGPTMSSSSTEVLPWSDPFFNDGKMGRTVVFFCLIKKKDLY